MYYAVLDRDLVYKLLHYRGRCPFCQIINKVSSSWGHFHPDFGVNCSVWLTGQEPVGSPLGCLRQIFLFERTSEIHHQSTKFQCMDSLYGAIWTSVFFRIAFFRQTLGLHWDSYQSADHHCTGPNNNMKVFHDETGIWLIYLFIKVPSFISFI